MSISQAIEPVAGFDLHSFAILLHLLLLTFWLGTDLGVFYASRFIVDPTGSPAGRAVAAKIMHVIDLSPRICLVLMLPSGVTLMAASDLGREIFAGWPLALAWLIGLGWLAVMLTAFRGPSGGLAQRADITIRIAVAAGLLAAAGYALVATAPFGVDSNPRWLAGKVAAYALCIVGGLLIRVTLRPFGPAFARLMADGSTPSTEAAISGSIARAVPWVFFVWAMVLVATVLGVVKPGMLPG
ncbi:hypothetical protein [Micromonospora sp. LOL_023]|uniref:hypothetical protein n=1 Tax=Micromonospora sp. LOL_023 TaxID=3345418 RepID=UPI003A8BCE1F